MSQHDQKDGDWLSGAGEYRNLIHSLCASDPRLRQRDPKSVKHHIPWSTTPGRVVTLEAYQRPESSLAFKQTGAYDTPQSLKIHLETRPADDVQRVYILEGQNPNYIAVLGEYFRMHPSFFTEHERVDVIARGIGRESDAVVLPTMAVAREHFTLKYFELFRLPDCLRNTFWLYCAVTGRHIGATRFLGSFSEIGIVRRKCSVWRRQRQSNIGWDCVIITDPPLRLVNRDKKYNHNISAIPFRGGYLDFIPHEEQMKIRSGPPRISMLDDICFYLVNYSSLLELADPESVALLAKKVAASHYLQLTEFLRSILSSIQWSMSRQDKLDIFDITQVEVQWSDIQALERRISEYCEDLESIMIQCHISLQDPDIDRISNWKASWADFQFLQMRMKDIRHRVETLNSVITALAGIAGNRQTLKDQELSLKEAKSTKALTFLGLVFIPLAYTASLFSMAEPYGPGQDSFWLYFAIATPLIIFVVCIYYLIDRGYCVPGKQSLPVRSEKT